MSIASGHIRYKRYKKLTDGTYKLASQWTSSNTVEMNDGKTLEETITILKSSDSIFAPLIDQIGTQADENSADIIALTNRVTDVETTNNNQHDTITELQTDLRDTISVAENQHSAIMTIQERLAQLAISYYGDYDVTFVNGVGYATTMGFDTSKYRQFRGVIVNGFGTDYTFNASIVNANADSCEVVIRCSDTTVNETLHLAFIYFMVYAELGYEDGSVTG